MNIQTTGPGPQQLKEIAAKLVDRSVRLGHDELPVTGLQVDATYDDGIYAWRAQGHPDGTLYKPGENELVPQAVALSPDGGRAVFTIDRESRHDVVSTPVRLGAGGWLSRKLGAPERLGSVPAAVTDLGVAPDGAVAVAMGTEIRELRNGRLGPALTVPEAVADVQYLSDGSLAVRTDPSGGYNDSVRRFFWAPDATKPLVEVPLQSLSADQYEQRMRERLGSVLFLDGRPLEELERFDQGADWLGAGGQRKTFVSAQNPANPDVLAVLVKEVPGVSLWTWSHSEGKATCLGVLAGDEPGNFQMMWAPDGRSFGLWPARQTADLQSRPTTVDVFNFPAGGSAQRATLPGLDGLLVNHDRGALSFKTPQGREEVLLAEAGRVSSRPWFPEAVRRHEATLKGTLLGAESAQGGATIAVEDDYVDIGGIRVPVRGAAEPVPTAPVAPPAPAAQPALPAPAAEPVVPTLPATASAQPKSFDELVARLDAAKAEVARLDHLRNEASTVQYKATQAVDDWMKDQGWTLPSVWPRRS